MPGGARRTGGGDAGIPTGPPGTSGCPPAAARPVQPVRMTRALLHPLPPGLLPAPAPPGTPGTRAQGPALPLPGGAVSRAALSSCGQHRVPAGCSVPVPGGVSGEQSRWEGSAPQPPGVPSPPAAPSPCQEPSCPAPVKVGTWCPLPAPASEPMADPECRTPP